jgi:hypothetical protein
MRQGSFTKEQTAMLAFELAMYVSLRCDVPESMVEAHVSEAERSAIITEELARRSITDPRDQLARSSNVFDAAADRVEALLPAAESPI